MTEGSLVPSTTLIRAVLEIGRDQPGRKEHRFPVGEAAYLSPGAGCVTVSVPLAPLGPNPASAPGGVGLPAWGVFDCGLSSPQGHYSLLSMTSWPKNVEPAHQALVVARRPEPEAVTTQVSPVVFYPPSWLAASLPTLVQGREGGRPGRRSMDTGWHMFGLGEGPHFLSPEYFLGLEPEELGACICKMGRLAPRC